MKQFSKACRGYRWNISLLAGGMLSEPEKIRLQEHLQDCAGCRQHFEEIKNVTASLANWAENLPPIQPSESAHRRWVKAIEMAGQSETARQLPFVAMFRDWTREVLWPWRHVWAGLAAVWLVILAGNVSLREPSPAITAKSAAPSQEAVASFRDQQKLLAELLADHSAPRDAERQKFFSPKPRTERYEVISA